LSMPKEKTGAAMKPPVVFNPRRRPRQQTDKQKRLAPASVAVHFRRISSDNHAKPPNVTAT